MAPKPTRPTVLPANDSPDRRGQPPARVSAAARSTGRASSSSKATVNSATERALAPGVLVTTIPRAAAAARSTLSTPTP